MTLPEQVLPGQILPVDVDEVPPVELGPGDYISYPGDAGHVFEALAPGTWATLIVESP